jgi:glycosyltransferase involved in cell wall biosynthesis
MDVHDLPPRVCIGVPVYNGERFLARTLEGLLGQTHADIEILISDNASTDGTRAICERFASDDPRVHYYRNPANLGSTGNVRRLGELARGPYFKLANADDLCTPDLVESCIAVLEREPRVVLCCGQSRLIDVDGKDIRAYDDAMHIRSPDPVVRFRTVIGRIRLTNALQGVMRTTVVKQLFPWYGSYDGADEVLLAAITLYGEVHQIARTLFYRRIHPGAVSATRGHAAMQLNLDPAKPRALPAYLTKIHLGYVREIARAPLPAGAKGRLALVVLRSLAFQRGAWARELVALGRRLLRARRSDEAA